MTDTVDRVLSCDCCGEPTISARGAYDICSVCGWEDDPVQSDDPDCAGGANVVSLNVARENYRRSGRADLNRG
jgi:hypothetical protein